MSVSLFIQNTYYVINLDSPSLRAYPAYQCVRDEINRRMSPLSGGTDWQQVNHHCEWLAKGPGVDLLMASYWAVANLKTQGLEAFANGLELLNAIVSMLPQATDNRISSGRKDSLDWVNARAVQELKALRPDISLLRALYRCERYCDQLHRMIALKQPQHAVNFEGVGFALFEHIDRLEAQLYTTKTEPAPQVAVPQNTPQPPKRRSWFRWGMTGTLLVLTAVSGILAYQWQHHWSYFHVERVIDVAALKQQSNIEAWQSPVIKNDVMGMLTQSVHNKLAMGLGNKAQWLEQDLEAMEHLYPEDAAPLRQLIDSQQQSAIDGVDGMVTRFTDIRTRVANVVAQHQGQRDYPALHSLEKYAVSLSPVYGRVEYIERLLEDGKMDEAQQEFAILTQRLDDLGWKWGALEQQLTTQSH
ncbi:type VI secretion system ImpA family N-terminal domain-containing protein [Vibrio alginolyticus]|uniref:type VI secretion system ImpA family N-terminal domain-containing protein n=1 Tax=Vibrio alginolyticus TaxID=663 RepID=UPI002119CC27|nr:type VI secretion system ImpA family N-terminal domain-containing protein [Vibrio alginolyticus]MCQ9087106.1 type VI secretion system ImpA family N-terminal domain-containing protein [Vibrio alginolyticus]